MALHFKVILHISLTNLYSQVPMFYRYTWKCYVCRCRLLVHDKCWRGAVHRGSVRFLFVHVCIVCIFIWSLLSVVVKMFNHITPLSYYIHYLSIIKVGFILCFLNFHEGSNLTTSCLDKHRCYIYIHTHMSKPLRREVLSLSKQPL